MLSVCITSFASVIAMADRERSNDQVKLEITFNVYQLLTDNTKTRHIQR